MDMTWNSDTDKSFDSSKSKIGLVFVAVHNSKFRLFEVGKPLQPEVRALVQNGTFRAIVRSVRENTNVNHVDYQSSGKPQGALRFNLQTQVGQVGNMTRFSFIGQLIGTPDYFFGVSNINLCNGAEFIKNTKGKIQAFDAGYDARTSLAAQLTPENRGVTVDNRTTLVGEYGSYSITRKAVCFPSDATVLLENGVTKRMDELSVGDRVAVGAGLYSEVFMFTHKTPAVQHKFVSITTESKATIRLTDGHYLPLNGGVYTPAGLAKVGDTVLLGDGTISTITALKVVFGTGLFNPQTLHGDIIVDGIVASTYTTAVQRSMAHAMLAPLRMLCTKLGFSSSVLANGADSVASVTSLFA